MTAVKRAVVFSGGGAKGGYQIGAWKALREIGFAPDIVTGTSVGALNGALMALGKYEDARSIWENMSMNRVFSQFVETHRRKTCRRKRSSNAWPGRYYAMAGLISRPCRSL